MIYSLNGKLIEKNESGVVVECGGVGFYVSCSTNTLSTLDEDEGEVFLYTVFSVKENGMELAGFSTKDERDLFRLLCSVNGVGTKVAFSILSTYTPDRLILLLGSNDSHALTACSGVGQRLAQRICVELKDKVAGLAVTGLSDAGSIAVSSSSVSEALAALISLGFSNAQASRALSSLPQNESTETLITEALRILAPRK